MREVITIGYKPRFTRSLNLVRFMAMSGRSPLRCPLYGA
jgi:hypothetical protein